MNDPILGVVEGFYGPPWSWEERERMVEFLGRHGYNLYVYAPKDDALHRASWRDLYLPEELKPFRHLAQRCVRAGIEFVYGISPVDIRNRDKADLAVLLDKVEQLQELGIGSFCLLFDDLPGGLPEDDAGRVRAAHHQAGLAAALLRRLSANGPTRLIFTPTEYCGKGDSAYLRTLGAELPSEIEVFWTGPQVCSATITVADLRRVTRSLRRKPLIWDNYPVNDGEMRLDPHIRPLRGRDPALPGAISGIAANPAIEAEDSKIALHTLASWWRDPARYDPDRAWDAALREVGGGRTEAEELRVLGLLTRRSPIEPGTSRQQPVPAFVDFWSRWEAGDRAERGAALAGVRSDLDQMAAAAEQLRGALPNRALRHDLDRWARKLAIWCTAALPAVEALRAAQSGREEDAAEQRREAVNRLNVARRESYRVSDRQFEAFVRRCLFEATALIEGAPSAAKVNALLPEVAP